MITFCEEEMLVDVEEDDKGNVGVFVSSLPKSAAYAYERGRSTTVRKVRAEDFADEGEASDVFGQVADPIRRRLRGKSTQFADCESVSAVAIGSGPAEQSSSQSSSGRRVESLHSRRSSADSAHGGSVERPARSCRSSVKSDDSRADDEGPESAASRSRKRSLRSRSPSPLGCDGGPEGEDAKDGRRGAGKRKLSTKNGDR